jgi:hypothetical protein
MLCGSPIGSEDTLGLCSSIWFLFMIQSRMLCGSPIDSQDFLGLCSSIWFLFMIHVFFVKLQNMFVSLTSCFQNCSVFVPVAPGYLHHLSSFISGITPIL